jgi:hypothetical protein
VRLAVWCDWPSGSIGRLPLSTFSSGTVTVFFARDSNISSRTAVANTHAIILEPVRGGWAVSLTDGRQLASFRGPLARCRALRYLALVLGTKPGLRGRC